MMRDRFIGWMLILVGLLIMLLAFSGCKVVQGFGQMSDKWCDAHPQASKYRCWNR